MSDPPVEIKQPAKFVWSGEDTIEWDDEVTEADTRPGDGDNRLKEYWTRGEGRAKWVDHPHPWTSLYRHLVKYMPAEMARRTAAQWHHDVFGIWPGEKKGKNPAGPG